MRPAFCKDFSSISLPIKIHVIIFFMEPANVCVFVFIYLCMCARASSVGKCMSVYCEVLIRKKVEAPVRCLPRRAGCFWQAPSSPACMAWIEQKANVSLLMAGQTTRQSRFLGGVYYRAESKTEFQLCSIWSFCLEGLISSFSGVSTMRQCLTIQLRQSCFKWPLSSACFV